ncbi:hypothetical protein ACGLWX_09695 [Halomonas sp. HMF6819]|uniref:hypothetical protein n=1 Tax=Halomonas sp. HMF6819 TaxID=3373085 RepID=UPI0037B6E473
MRILVPLNTLAEHIKRSNVPDDEVAVYDPAATYTRGQGDAIGDLAVEGDTVYEYVGLEPVSGLAPSEGERQVPKQWIVHRTTNPTAMWNGIIGDATKSAAPWFEGEGRGIQFEIELGRRAGGVAFFGLRNVDSIRVEMIDPREGVVFDETRSMRSRRGINSYWSWFFEPIERRVDAIFDKLPPYAAKLRISLQAAGDQAAECGACLIGPVRQYGFIEWKSGGKVLSFTEATRTRGGRLELRRGESVKAGSFRVSMRGDESDAIIKRLTDIEGLRVVFMGTDMYETALIYGIYEGLTFVYENKAFHNYSMEVLGLT